MSKRSGKRWHKKLSLRSFSQGVTGSGKTEVYLRSIEATLELGRMRYLLVPEIALTPASGGTILPSLREPGCHSCIPPSARRKGPDQWRRIRNGKHASSWEPAQVFSRPSKPGAVIVDEEHDGSYKQQETPRYHGRDVALVRARERRSRRACWVLPLQH